MQKQKCSVPNQTVQSIFICDCVNLELKALPKNIKEGDVINFQENSYFLNSDETKARKEKIKNLMNSLFED